MFTKEKTGFGYCRFTVPTEAMQKNMDVYENVLRVLGACAKRDTYYEIFVHSDRVVEVEKALKKLRVKYLGNIQLMAHSFQSGVFHIAPTTVDRYEFANGSFVEVLPDAWRTFDSLVKWKMGGKLELTLVRGHEVDVYLPMDVYVCLRSVFNVIH